MAPPSPFRRSVTGRVSVVAHRGLSAEEPENTMRAFRRAAEVGCDLIEFDVHLSRDAEVVVMHDDTVDRTTDGHGAVRDLSLRELGALDAGRGERVPTLDEVCAWAGRSDGFGLSVEIKQPTPVGGAARYADIAERVLDIVRAHDLEGRVLVHSFDHPTIRRLRELAPELPTAISYGGGTFVDPLVLGRSADASGVHPWWAWASPAVCAAAHDAGLHVHAWGASWPPRAEEIVPLVRAGIDSLDANDPRVLRRLLADMDA
jgi:glycerophosphoryl diester phosphodiesterase